MKTKNTIKAVIILSLVFVMSGCSMNVNKPQGGFFKSLDGGNSFFQEETESGLVLKGKNITAMEINPNNDKEIFVGTSSFGLFKTVDEGKNWLADVNGFSDIKDIQILPGTTVIYMVAKKDGRGKLFKSDTNGESWIESYTEKDDYSYLTSVAVHPKNLGTVYISNSKGGLFKSEDGGATWKNLYWASSLIRKIELDSVNPNVIYLATERNGLVRSSDGGNSFEEIIDRGSIYNVVAHPNREGSVYASTAKGLQRSLNFGNDWEMINTLIKSEEIASQGIAINPQNPDEIYFASGLTFYKSTNNGDTWSTTQFDVSSSIEIIRVNPNDSKKIYLGTNRNVSGLKLIK